jgi:VWFA-related protein
MTKCSILFGSAALAALVCFTNLPARAAASENTDDRATAQMIVTAQSKHHDESAPDVEKQDVAVYENGHRANVVSWSALKGPDAAMQLFVVLDSSSRVNAIGTHIAELRSFMRALPPTASVALGYMTNGRVQVAESFTDDHEAAAKAVSLPGGSVGSNASPYFALSDLAKHWPAAPSANARRVVLWLTDGIDPYDTSMDMSNDIYLQASVADAQRAGIQVYSIYLSGKGGVDRSIYGVSQGQSKLSIVAEQTGGVAYNQGFTTPVSLLPYLDDFRQQLNNQYRVVFESPNEGAKAALEDVRMKTELAGVKLTSPAKVYVRPAFKAD